MTRLLAVLAASGALCAIAPAAQAASLPTGKYDCKYFESNRTFGQLTFTAKTYRFNKNKAGKYAVSGRKITFKSGSMKGVFEHAEWKKGTGGVVYINLYDGPEFDRTYTDAQCIKRKS
jgi:hypothetical protein